MPKGMEIRRAQLIEMHATLVNIPEGADILEYLNRAADEAGYIPVVILSGMGGLSVGTFRVPNDDALGELMDVEKSFNVKVVTDLENNPELRDLPFVEPSDDMRPEDLPDDFPHPPKREPKPHWSAIQHFHYPLNILYAHGGRRRQASSFKYHFIMSGCASRRGGVSESFVGELLPGCIARGPTQFVVGLSATGSTTVQAWTISIQAGYDVIAQIKTFVKARQNLGDCFIFSASGGKLREAKLKNLNAEGVEEIRVLDADEGAYIVEGMSAIINADVESLRIHAAIIVNCSKPPCDAAGGELVEAIVSEGQPLDIYLGELVDEQYITD